MEIKINAGDRIFIPENCTATIEDNLIIIEEEQSLFKDGDILHSYTTDSMAIFKSYEGKSRTAFSSYYNNCNLSNSDWSVSYFRHATEEEKRSWFDSLKEQGLYWNAGTKELERIRKRGRYGDRYLCVEMYGGVVEYGDYHLESDDNTFNFGNYYLPEEREQAEEDAKAVKAIFEKRLKIIQD